MRDLDSPDRPTEDLPEPSGRPDDGGLPEPAAGETAAPGGGKAESGEADSGETDSGEADVRGGSDAAAGEPAAEEPATPAAGGGVPKLGLQAKVLVGALLLVAAVALFWPRGDGSFEAPGGFLTDAAGRPQTLGPRMTPVTLVHFWATWCPPCVSEAPSLDRMIQAYADVPQFNVLLVAVGDDISKVQTFLGDRAGQALYDPNWDVAHRYGTHLLPETYLVVRGQVVQKWEGAQNWDDPAMRGRLDRALAEVGVDVAAQRRAADGGAAANGEAANGEAAANGGGNGGG